MQNRHAALRIVDSVTHRPESQIANRTRALRIRSMAQNGGIENRRRFISVYALVIISYENVPCGATPIPPVCGPKSAVLKQASKISKLANVSNAPKATNQTLVPNKVSKPKSQTHCFEAVKH